MHIGYFCNRDSTPTAETEKARLCACGVERVYEETCGASASTPELERMLDFLRPGDVVTVPGLPSMGLTLSGVVRVVAQIGDAGCGFRALDEGIDTTASSGSATDAMALFSALAAFQEGRRVRSERQRSWCAVPSGQKRGRRPKLSTSDREEIVALIEEGLSGVDVAKKFRVNPSTVSRVLAAARRGGGNP
jgi:DNA invertase Pin-like site-specific DNA recombinase